MKSVLQPLNVAQRALRKRLEKLEALVEGFNRQDGTAVVVRKATKSRAVTQRKVRGL